MQAKTGSCALLGKSTSTKEDFPGGILVYGDSSREKEGDLLSNRVEHWILESCRHPEDKAWEGALWPPSISMGCGGFGLAGQELTVEQWLSV